MIEKIFPGTNTKLRILKTIYENPGVNITQLIKRARASPNLTIGYVNALTKFRVVRERVVGKGGKAHVRELEANLTSSLGRLLFAAVEVEKRYKFLKKYREFRPIFAQLDDFFSDSDVRFCLIHGSFARFSATRESDVDVLIVGKLKRSERSRISEIFVTLRREYSVEIETPETFIKNAHNPFHQTILKDHIIVWNELGFVEILSSLQRIFTP